jgi:hypothetical protein
MLIDVVDFRSIQRLLADLSKCRPLNAWPRSEWNGGLLMHNVKNILSLAMLLMFLGVPTAIQTRSMSAAADLPQTTRKTDKQRLTGRWIRPDGGYILELKDIKKDGKLKASYFNPSSINVFRAERNRKEGRINIFVELRDVN